MVTRAHLLSHPLVRKHRPAGYLIKCRPLPANDGMTEFTREITIDSKLEERAALFVFLHEAGHVHNRHLRECDKNTPRWEAEYEADQYAIKAMRAAGLAVPRERMREHRKVLIEYIAEAQERDEHIPDPVLRYAFGRQWRKHR